MSKIYEQLGTGEVKAFAKWIEKLEKEIEEQELNGGAKYDWRVARVGNVDSESWNEHMQEIELELEKMAAARFNSASAKELQRIKQLAGIAKPHVAALATKQAKRQIK